MTPGAVWLGLGANRAASPAANLRKSMRLRQKLGKEKTMQFFRFTLLTVFVLCAASFAAAQTKGTFQAATTVSAGPATIPSNTGFLLGGISPIQGVTGDFNGDGKADAVYLASCSQGSSNGQYGIPNCPAFNGSVVVSYLGNGNGTFQTGILSAGPVQGARSIAAGDVNGDGMMDVVTVSDCNPTDCSYGTLTIMLGNGDGTFTAGASYPVNGAVVGANTITTGDLNGDGHQDIIIGLGCDFSNSGCSTGAVLVFLGNGDGTFQSPKRYPTIGNAALPVVIGDFNKDGKPDVLLVGTGVLVFFPGNGDGTLGNSSETSLPAGFGGAGLAAADFNSDGNLDAVIGGANSVALALGNGDGTFQAPVVYSLAITIAEFPQNVIAADMNGDGKPDIVVGEGQGGGLNAVGVLLNDGTGNFTNIANYAMGGTGTASAAVADFNGDGKNDILLASSSATTANDDGLISLLFGNGDGTFRSVQYVSTAGIGAGVGSVAAADFNGDGFQDLVIPVCPPGCSGASGFALFLSDGAGGYQQPSTFTTTAAVGAEWIAVGDFNGDGKPDVAVFNECDATCAGTSVSVFLNSGNGNFAVGVVYEIGGSNPLAIVTGDFKGNGKLDIAMLNQCYTSSCGGQGSVAVLLNNGDGTFQPVITTPTNGLNGVYGLAAADLNHDGLTDLVVTEDDVDNANDASATAAQILMGNGDGTFTLGGNYLTGGDRGLGATVAIGDVNSDGIPDIVAANNCDSIVGDVNCARGLISVLLGNGNGTFLPASTTAVPDSNFDGVSLADVNADGKLDIVASTGQGITVLWGNGDGTFQNPTNYSGGATIQNSQLALADLGNGGGLDIVQPSYLGQLTIFYNQGFALPSSTTTVQTSVNPSIYGQNVTFTATVTSTSGTPTGTVTFTVDGVPESVELSAGSASFTTFFNVGTHSIAASYSGDADHSASNSAAVQQVVNPAMTTTVLTSSANPSYVTQSITYTATVTSQFPGYVKGSITFKDGTTVLEGIILPGSLANGAGIASLSEQYSIKGTHSITATYSGDSNNLGSASATLKQTVEALPAATKTVVTTSGSPSLINESVVLTAAVTSSFGPIPDGELVTFLSGTTILATVPLVSGTAAYSTSTLKAGTSAITVKYPGDTDFKASTAIVKQVVNLYSSSTSMPASNLNPSNFGQAVMFTATVTSTAPSTPTGTVTFKNGVTPLATATLDASGVATLTRTNLPLGSLSITASYNGDPETAKSTSLPLTQAVNQAQTTMTLASAPNPSAPGASVKFTATLASNGGVPTGTVTFTSGAVTLGTATVANGKATFLTKTLPQGADQITATYAGNADYSPANASATQQVN